jgi:hypothetical protein
VARGTSDLRRALTFGGQAPLSVGALIAAMVVATVGGTLWPPLANLLVLPVPRLDGPSWVLLLEIWRLVTWPFFQERLPNSLLTLLFASFMLLWLGRQLSYAWSERRFLLRFFVLTAGAGAATLAVMVPFAPFGARGTYYGIWAVLNALLVTWGLIFPNQRISWFGALDMTGATVAKIFTFGTPVWAVVVGWSNLGLLGALADYLPHLTAVALAWLLVAGGPRRGWWRLREWWLWRNLEQQRRKFKVISTDAPRPKPKAWMN